MLLQDAVLQSWRPREHLHVVSALTLFGLGLRQKSLEGIPQTRPAGPGAAPSLLHHVSPRATKKMHQFKKTCYKIFCPPFSQLLSELSHLFSKWGATRGRSKKYIHKNTSHDCLQVKNVVNDVVCVCVRNAGLRHLSG